jgi:hypothetical protein
VAAQCVTISVARARKTTRHQKVTAPLEHLEERMLVCGNLLSWGMHGIAFARNENSAELWPAVAEALYRLRRADRLLGNTDLVMIKDITDEYASGAAGLAKFSYRPLETDPNMILEISPKWRSFEDYLANLTSKYRKTARQIDKDVTAAGCVVEQLSDVGPHAEAIHELYMQTHRNAKFRPVTLPVTFIPTLAARLGDDLRCTVIRRDQQLLGFVTTLRDGETAVGYNIGFDRKANADFPIYFRLLNTVIDDAIKFGCRSLSLGRTALEPKARLGARPEQMRVWIRHRIPMLNVLVRGLLHTHNSLPACCWFAWCSLIGKACSTVSSCKESCIHTLQIYLDSLG